MSRFDVQLWREGFRAGEALFTECPYAKGSWQAKNWCRGWTEGAAKALGHDYKAEPTGSIVPLPPGRAMESTPFFETPLQKAQRHVVEAEMRVLRQTFLVSEMQNKGLDASQAKEVLNVFKNALRLMHHELAYEKKRAGLLKKS